MVPKWTAARLLLEMGRRTFSIGRHETETAAVQSFPKLFGFEKVDLLVNLRSSCRYNRLSNHHGTQGRNFSLIQDAFFGFFSIARPKLWTMESFLRLLVA